MSEINLKQLIEVATKHWEQHRKVSARDRLNEYFKYAK